MVEKFVKILFHTAVTGLSVVFRVIKLQPEKGFMVNLYLVSVLGADAFWKREFMAVFLRIFCFEVR